jgi:hypothetical protein
MNPPKQGQNRATLNLRYLTILNPDPVIVNRKMIKSINRVRWRPAFFNGTYPKMLFSPIKCLVFFDIIDYDKKTKAVQKND